MRSPLYDSFYIFHITFLYFYANGTLPLERVRVFRLFCPRFFQLKSSDKIRFEFLSSYFLFIACFLFTAVVALRARLRPLKMRIPKLEAKQSRWALNVKRVRAGETRQRAYKYLHEYLQTSLKARTRHLFHRWHSLTSRESFIRLPLFVMRQS